MLLTFVLCHSFVQLTSGEFPTYILGLRQQAFKRAGGVIWEFSARAGRIGQSLKLGRSLASCFRRESEHWSEQSNRRSGSAWPERRNLRRPQARTARRCSRTARRSQ